LLQIEVLNLKLPPHIIKVAQITLVFCIVLIVAFSAINPSENQLVSYGFDRHLLDIDQSVGVNLAYNKLELTSMPDQIPFVTTITTTSSFNVTFNAAVIKQSESSMPVQVALWDPITSDAFSIFFSYPNTVYCGTRKSSNNWETIIEMGKYSTNSSNVLSISFEANKRITFSFSNSTWSNETVINSGAILQRPMVNLSFFSSSSVNESVSIFDNYSVVIPTQSYYSYFVGSLKGWLFLVYAGISGLIVFAFKAEFLTLFRKSRASLKRLKWFSIGSKDRNWLLAIIFVSIFVQMIFSTLGSNPYDIFTQKVWAYTTSRSGFEGLYPVSLLVPSGSARFGWSVVNSYFPYPPLQSYPYLLVGQIYSLFSPAFNFSSPFLSFLIKLPSFLVTALVSCLIFFFVKKQVNSKYAILLTFLFAIMPGLVFDTAIWGQPDVMLAFLMICSILTFEFSSPASLFFLVASLLTKQTAVFPAALLFLFILRKHGLRKTLYGSVFAVGCVFLLLLPFLYSGYSLSFIANVSVGDKVFNIASAQPLGVPEWQKTVSGGAHNIWPIISHFSNNQIGWLRFTYTDSATNQILGIPYVSFGLFLLLLSFISVFVLGFISLRNKRQVTAKIAFFSYLSVFSLYLFSTRMHERYLFLTIPFLILSFPWFKNRKIFAALFASLSATFFISMYSNFVLASTWVPQSLPNFLPSSNPLNSVAFLFVSNDLGISALCIANILIFAFSMVFACFQLNREFSFRKTNHRVAGTCEFLFLNCENLPRECTSKTFEEINSVKLVGNFRSID
jgi:hypothetical protein